MKSLARYIVTGFVCAGFLSGCGNPLGGNRSVADDGFHPGVPGDKDPVSPPPVVPAPVGGDTGMKISPGDMRAAGTNLGLKATISNNDHKAAGPNVSASLSLNKSTLR